MVTATPSNPQRRLPYQSFNMTAGVDRMRRLGMRYYVAASAKALAAAGTNPDLRVVAQAAPFTIYEISSEAKVFAVE